MTSLCAKTPNVIILVADQLRYQSVGFTDSRAITPHIDRLRAEGVLFKNFVSSTPVCSAFRGSLLTGKYASSTGYVVNELRMNPNHDSVAHVLSKGGYKTNMIGKWHLWANKAGGHAGAVNNYVPPGPSRLGFDDFWATYNFGHRNFTSCTATSRARFFAPMAFVPLRTSQIWLSALAFPSPGRAASTPPLSATESLRPYSISYVDPSSPLRLKTPTSPSSATGAKP